MQKYQKQIPKYSGQFDGQRGGGLEKEKGRRGGQGRREALVSTKKGGEGQGSAQVGGESFLPGQQALPCWKD